ncbi:dipeptide transport ATP-binding protein DppD [Caldalkalibacillus thermarum]|uniref:ABC transporter ATP-binding protein n=1 Tax=Caldalkalibacillus thermarum TaxID=296745 RepID=UPI00166951EB|nr:ABC transporter ATP-binding protein [Caldalkalibacillus thermarum]GGK18011.1 dipeptide transport ATP-binding protein DppD [Caldalkalibacillus thermarum]
MSEQILEVNQLHVTFKTYGGEVQAVRGVSFSLAQGETLAIVGESGCGKSVTAQSIMRLIPEPPGRITSGSIIYKGKDLTKLSDRQMRNIRGPEIAMIFQDSMTSLNPTIKVGEQLIEGLTKHRPVSRKEARAEAVKYMQLVGIPYPEERLKQYPHQFSGGMRQRLMIAMALITQPSILIADEPTTALDVTIQAQIIELFKQIQAETGVSIIMITHDLGVVAQIADRVSVMYAGKIVESGSVKDIFKHPQHPYTKGLLQSIPRLDQSRHKPLIPIPGTPPDLFAPPPGCPFVDRCPYALEVCKHYEPPVTDVTRSHRVSCWLQDERAKPLITIKGGGAIS